MKTITTFVFLIFISVSCSKTDFYNKPVSGVSPQTEVPTNGTYIDVEENFSILNEKQNMVDILLDIDNSGSMADNQESLSKNINLFIRALINQNLDFQFSVTTTDATKEHNGKKVCDDTKLNSAFLKKVGSSKFIKNMMNCVMIGTNGSGVEQGLQTSSNFLNRYNKTFLRKNSKLSIVIVSDEEDQSENTVESYVSNIQKYRSDAKIYSIITKDISHKTGDESIGTRYMLASSLTGGLNASITDDWDTTLDTIGSHIAEQFFTFKLKNAPKEGSLHLYNKETNEEIIAGFIYDQKENTLTFDLNQFPKENISLLIKYQFLKPRN